MYHPAQEGISATSQISKEQGAKAQVANSSRESVAALAQDDVTRWPINAALSQQQQQQASQYQRAPHAQSYAAQLEQLQQAAYHRQAEQQHQRQQQLQAPAALAFSNTSDLQAAAAAQQFQQAAQLQQAQLQQSAQLQQMQQAAQFQDLTRSARFSQSQLDSLLLARGISAQNQGHATTSAQQQQLPLDAMLAASGDPS
eukprot:3175652-Ditylum_brightwellii.AAC.1